MRGAWAAAAARTSSLLAEQQQDQQSRQVNQRVVEEPARGGAAVSLGRRVEPARQVDEVQVDWQRVDSERPRGDVG